MTQRRISKPRRSLISKNELRVREQSCDQNHELRRAKKKQRLTPIFPREVTVKVEDDLTSSMQNQLPLSSTLKQKVQAY